VTKGNFHFKVNSDDDDDDDDDGRENKMHTTKKKKKHFSISILWPFASCQLFLLPIP
jgi:hypothetical protein